MATSVQKKLLPEPVVLAPHVHKTLHDEDETFVYSLFNAWTGGKCGQTVDISQTKCFLISHLSEGQAISRALQAEALKAILRTTIYNQTANCTRSTRNINIRTVDSRCAGNR